VYSYSSSFQKAAVDIDAVAEKSAGVAGRMYMITMVRKDEEGGIETCLPGGDFQSHYESTRLDLSLVAGDVRRRPRRKNPSDLRIFCIQG